MADKSLDAVCAASVARKRAFVDLSCGKVSDVSSSPTKLPKRKLLGGKEYQDLLQCGKDNAHGKEDGGIEEDGNAGDVAGSLQPSLTVSMLAPGEVTANGTTGCDSNAIEECDDPAGVIRNRELRTMAKQDIGPSSSGDLAGFSAKGTVFEHPKIQQDIPASSLAPPASSSRAGAVFSAPKSVTERQKNDPELRRRIHTIETNYAGYRRDEYNDERFKLYTEEEAKEAFIVWPREEVHSPAGYREHELEPWWTGGPGLDDVLFRFAMSFAPNMGQDEVGAEKRWRDGIESKFEDPTERKAEFERWEKIREVESDYSQKRIERDEYNERRFALYSEGERKENGIWWSHAENEMPRSPAGFRKFILKQFPDEKLDHQARMDFHKPNLLKDTDTTEENNFCELCVSLVEEHGNMLKKREAEEAKWVESQKAKKAKRVMSLEAKKAKKARKRDRLKVEREALRLAAKAEEQKLVEREKLTVLERQKKSVSQRREEELREEEADKVAGKRIDELSAGIAETEDLLEKMKQELRGELDKREVAKKERGKRVAKESRTLAELAEQAKALSDPRPFPCTICPKRFASASGVLNHTKDKHKGTNSASLVCIADHSSPSGAEQTHLISSHAPAF